MDININSIKKELIKTLDKDRYNHTVGVSYTAMCLAMRYEENIKNAEIAGLLHDFYPWSWMYSEDLEDLDDGKYLVEVRTKHSLFEMHAFTHAEAAAKNYIKYFPELEDERITNAIKRHMFPLNIIPPKNKEGFIISFVDKVNSCNELPSPSFVTDKIKNSKFGLWVTKKSE